MHNTKDMMFTCDVMLGSLARWLRAAGYDATWSKCIGDWDLVRLARREKRVLLSADTGIFRIGIVRDGDVPALQVPNGLTAQQQLAYVMCQLRLEPREPRCMACGGVLLPVSKDEVRGRVPAGSYARFDQFCLCQGCRQVYWQGSHWPRIANQLEQVRRLLQCDLRSDSSTAAVLRTSS
jgi:uncharacterized protein with PIN domain